MADSAVRVRITDPKHPHCGQEGVLTGETIKTSTGTIMAKMKLDRSRLGVQACYVAKGQVTSLEGIDGQA